MSKYIIKRILIAIPVLLGITIIDYAIMCLAGSRWKCSRSQVSQAAVEAKRIALGLDQLFMSSILSGWGSCSREIWGIPLKVTSR